MSGCGVAALLVLLLSAACCAPLPPAPRALNAPRANPAPRLAALVSAETRGLEVPRDLIAGVGAGAGAMQLVINVHTDSSGNIEVYTN